MHDGKQSRFRIIKTRKFKKVGLVLAWIGKNISKKIVVRVMLVKSLLEDFCRLELLLDGMRVQLLLKVSPSFSLQRLSSNP